MNTATFLIDFQNDGKSATAEVRPCCNEDNVVDYAILIGGKLAFTITRDLDNKHWVIAMKNSDDEFSDEMIQAIGAKIANQEMLHS